MMTDTRTPQEIARDYEDRIHESYFIITEFRPLPNPVTTWPDKGAVPWKPDVLSQILEQTRRTDHKAALSTIAALAADALAERGE